MGEILLIILCFILMALGFAGIFLPVLPGIPVVWLGLFTYSVATGFEDISITTVLVFLALTLFTILFDFLAPILGAKKYKASKLCIFGAFIGSLKYKPGDEVEPGKKSKKAKRVKKPKKDEETPVFDDEPSLSSSISGNVCKKCGSTLEKGDTFCPNCGASTT